jgi:hypothetical protein
MILRPGLCAPASQIDALADIAWRDYCETHQSPRTRKAGAGFTDPNFELSIEWLDARAALAAAAVQHADPIAPACVHLICAASRNDKTCRGEMAKTFRLTSIAQQTLETSGCAVDLLDLSLLTSEAHKVIYPCKAGVFTSMARCHGPCSCDPNHVLGQVNDWMNEIYPRWVAAHAMLIVTPVYW